MAAQTIIPELDKRNPLSFMSSIYPQIGDFIISSAACFAETGSWTNAMAPDSSTLRGGVIRIWSKWGHPIKHEPADPSWAPIKPLLARLFSSALHFLSVSAQQISNCGCKSRSITVLNRGLDTLNNYPSNETHMGYITPRWGVFVRGPPKWILAVLLKRRVSL